MKRLGKIKWIAAVLSLSLISGCGTPSGQENKKGKEQVSLYDRGLRLVERMDTMAESENYWNMMTSSQEMAAVIKEIGAQDYSAPRAVYQVSLSENSMDLLKEFLGGDSSYDELPEELREELEDRLASSISTRFSAMAGTEMLAAASVLASSDHFIDSSLTENLTYFYIYDNGYWGAVTFLPYEDGIVHASGLMIKSDVFGEAGEEELFQWFTEYGGLLEEDISKVSP